jgi:hypothetical protein
MACAVLFLRYAMKMPDELRSEAERYRRLVVGTNDRRAIEALNELATEYDELAGHLGREQRIRRRAYEMWEEQGQPRGLHIDHWISAEQELSEGGQG